MSSKIKVILFLTIFFLMLFFSLKAEPVPGSGDDDKNIEDIIKKVFPSVVKVEARNRTLKVATGVVVDKKGFIVTTALISPRDEEIFITTSGGKRIEAEFLGMDAVTHLALIQAKEKALPPIKMGKSKDLSPGTWIGVVSISPENTPAVTQGIISSITQDNLRLNAWVLPGWSGSPVVDREGRMVGLLRGIYTDDKPVIFEFREKELVGSGYVFSKAEAPSSGMALAIPVSVVEDITSEIKKKGKVERGWLGVNIAEDEENRVEILNVEKDSPAELAKLKRGDIILEIDGEEVTSSERLAYEIRKRKPGEIATLKIEREGKLENIEVRLGEYSERDIKREFELRFPKLFPPKPPEPPKVVKPFKPLEPEMFRWGWESRKYIGVYLEELNRELSEYFGVKEGKGLLVSKTSEDSPAEKAGLKVGDVIIKADGKRVESVGELSELIRDKEKGERIKIDFIRDKRLKSVEVEIEEEERSDFYFSSRNWEAYVDSWDKYRENLKRQYKKWQGRYGDDFKKKMKKLSEEIEKISKKVVEKNKKDVRELKYALKRQKAIKV